MSADAGTPAVSANADLDFFDCNAFLGGAEKGTWKPARGRAEILAVMDAEGIGRALVWHVGQQDWSAPGGNGLLAAEVREEPRLWGCWTVLPPHTGEVPTGDALFTAMREARVRALRIFPGTHRYVPGRTALGGVLDAASRRRIPLFLSLLRSGMDWACVDGFLAEFPDLLCVLCDVGIWGVDRFLRPLLARFPGVRAETSLLALHDGVLDRLVQDFGARRFLFGSGFPDRLPASAMLPLIHADMSGEDRRRIAGGNLSGMIGEAEP